MSLGQGERRVLLSSAIWAAGCATLAVAAGLGTDYRVAGLGTVLGVTWALCGLTVMRLVLRPIGTRQAVGAVTVVLLVAGLGQFFAFAAGSRDVITEQPSSDDSIRATLALPKFALIFDNFDGLVVTVEQGGLLRTSGGSLCLSGTSGPPGKAPIRWRDEQTFTVILGEEYGYGSPRFRVSESGLQALDRGWEPC